MLGWKLPKEEGTTPNILFFQKRVEHKDKIRYNEMYPYNHERMKSYARKQ